jgi:hypothetical protein
MFLVTIAILDMSGRSAMERSLSIARPIALSALIALVTSCAYKKPEGFYSDSRYEGYAYRADYEAGYRPNTDSKARPEVSRQGEGQSR